MFWLHSDIFDISLKFPPNYLGVHRLTNHYTARTRQINVTMPWKRHVIGVYFFTDSVRRDSVLCGQHYCIDRFYARQCLQQKPYPPNTPRKGLLCRAEYAYGEAGWTADEAAFYSKDLCSIFSYLFI